MPEEKVYSVWFLSRQATVMGSFEDEERQLESAASLVGKSVSDFIEVMDDGTEPLVGELSREDAGRLEALLREVGVDAITLEKGRLPTRMEEVSAKKTRGALIKHIHTTTFRQLQARTIHRDIWANVDATNPFLKSMVGVIFGYSCLSSYFFFLVPFILRSLMPQTRLAQRPLYNLGWDTLHNVVARVAAVAPEQSCDVFHHREGEGDFAWAVDGETGHGEEFAFDLEVVKGEGKDLDALLAFRWKGVELRQPQIERLKSDWRELVSETPISIEQSELGLYINAQTVATARDDTAERVGRWFSRLMILTRHGVKLRVEEPKLRARLEAPSAAQPIEELRAEASAKLAPSHAPVRPVPLQLRLIELCKYILIQHGMGLGLVLSAAITGLFSLFLVTFSLPSDAISAVMVFMGLVPAAASAWWIYFSSFGWTKRPEEEQLELRLENQKLSSASGTIDLERPFQTRFMRPHSRDDVVAVEIAQSRGVGEVSRIHFLVPVEASAEVAALPELDQRAGWLPREALTQWVWPTLTTYAKLHGQSLRWNFGEGTGAGRQQRQEEAQQQEAQAQQQEAQASA